MKRILRAVLVTGALLSSVLVASTGSTAQAGEGPPPTFNEIYESIPLTVNGDYTPIFGLGCASGEEEILPFIFWYAPGTGTEYMWEGSDDRTFSSAVGPAVNGHYEIESLGSGILFHKPGPGTDYFWGGLDAATGDHDSGPVKINGSYNPQATIFGFLLYGAGTAPDHLLYDWDEAGNTAAIPGTINGTYADDVRSPETFVGHVWHAPGSAPDALWLPAGLSEGSSASAADAMASAEAPEFTGRR